MKKVYSIFFLNILFALFCNITFAQNKNWQIGVKVMPEWSSFGNYELKSYDANGQTEIQYHNKFLWNAGFQIIKGMNKYLSLESGIYYSKKGITAFGYYYINHCPCEAILLAHKRNTYYRQYSYLNIPLILKLNIKGFYVGSGIGINKYISQKADDSQYNTYEINNWVFDLPVILGYQRKIYRSLNVFLEGRYTPTLSKIYKNSSEKAVNYGFGFGVNWTLNKK